MFTPSLPSQSTCVWLITTNKPTKNNNKETTNNFRTKDLTAFVNTFYCLVLFALLFV